MDPGFTKAYDEAWQEASIALCKLSTQGQVECVAAGTTHFGAVYDPVIA